MLPDNLVDAALVMDDYWQKLKKTEGPFRPTILDLIEMAKKQRAEELSKNS